MNAPKAPRRLSARREDTLPSLPAPNSGSNLSFTSSSSASRSRFAALAEKKPESYSSLSVGGVGSSGAAATPHKVWLGSLPSTLTEAELRERLACFGTIQSFYFKPEQPGAAALPADQPQHNKKARGWAFVSYATAEEAQALIRAVDGKAPDAVFPVAGSSLVAPGSAPPVEARLANASKNTTSTGSVSTVSDSRTVFSEEEPHSREKLLALAFFSPSHKPSAAGRASSLAPSSAGNSAADASNNSSIRCSSHPRITNISSLDKADGSDMHAGGNAAAFGTSAEFSRHTAGPLRGSAASPSSHSLPNKAPFLRGQDGKIGGQSLTDLHKQQLKLAAEETPPPPAPTSFPPPPAGSGNFGLPQQPLNSDKSGLGAIRTGTTTQKSQETASTPPATGDGGEAAASSPGAGAPTVSARAAALAPASTQEQQQQQPALDGCSAAAPVASQRGKRVYGGMHAAAFPPLSAATALSTGGSGARTQQQQQNRPDGPGLPSLWEVYWTPDTQQPYYYNAVSKHVQWERPLPPRDYVEQYGNPMTAELGPPAPLIPGVTRGVVAGKGGAVVGPQGSNLFVFHLPPEWSEQTFLRHFAPFGNVVSCKIQINAQTGKRGGFGFVSYDNPASAIASIRMLNGFAACGKMLKVQLKKGEEHLLPPDLQQQQQQQQQHQHQQSSHPTPAPPVGFTWSAAA